MEILPYTFGRKCDFGLCQNQADFCLQLGAKGQLIMCKEHLQLLHNATSKIVGNKQETTIQSKTAYTKPKTAKRA